MLREAHAVTSDHGVGMGIHIGRSLDSLAAESGTFFDLRPIDVTNGSLDFYVSTCLFSDEIDIENTCPLMRLQRFVVGGYESFAETHDCSEISTWTELVVLGADLGFRETQHLDRSLRIG